MGALGGILDRRSAPFHSLRSFKRSPSARFASLLRNPRFLTVAFGDLFSYTGGLPNPPDPSFEAQDCQILI